MAGRGGSFLTEEWVILWKAVMTLSFPTCFFTLNIQRPLSLVWVPLHQGSENYGPWAKHGPPPVLFCFSLRISALFLCKIIKNILINVCIFLSSGNAQYQESISSSPWRVFILISKNLDQFPPFYSLRFQMPWKIPMSFFNATTWYCK